MFDNLPLLSGLASGAAVIAALALTITLGRKVEPRLLVAWVLCAGAAGWFSLCAMGIPDKPRPVDEKVPQELRDAYVRAQLAEYARWEASPRLPWTLWPVGFVLLVPGAALAIYTWVCYVEGCGPYKDRGHYS